MGRITRKEAKALGLKYYTKCRPCPFGHIGKRKTINGGCVTCEISRTKEWREHKRAYLIEYNKKYKEKYRKEKKEHLRKLKAKHYFKYKKKIIASQYRYVKKNKAMVYARGHNRRAKIRGSIGKFSKSDIEFLERIQKNKCANCKCSISKKRHIDHIVPIAKNGSNDRKNIQLLCPSCNCRKNAKDPLVWARENGRLV